ncbi:hypothetical protein [Rhizorhabdus dicambivorans]|uniref:Lipoprotein n=1 Tax=Rhizorhabdus dicambivorans TaxID=1850238 RepID=A0A2A4G121_9SPHN|nr:hypothetical protein [Rhizorhabdus dicambivorans]ATE63207.1 hypothetical protein CMV14_01345 [Rhizorhabdus dicambivorans]PCE43420.1 hypothetical protein COO09_03665 [Rhizorhabdus dicambivorans]
MRKAVLGWMLPMLLLAGCELKVGKDGNDQGGDSASVSIGADGNIAVSANDGKEGVSIDTPGFGGRINIKGMRLGSDNMEIDGMKLYPGTELSAINVVDREGPDNGQVDMRFTSPAAPDKVAAYYADAGRAAGFRDVAVTRQGAAATFSAIKEDNDRVTISIAPAAGGSSGRIRVQDGK